ncbi:MAG: hypothetical protein HC780_29880 [Leptolyngbyaceae cyanobacterium CSU_1_3]|nr:hypothetical protein [Leptolyngbyaceae cyanobacterium CSU_1_3]
MATGRKRGMMAMAGWAASIRLGVVLAIAGGLVSGLAMEAKARSDPP